MPRVDGPLSREVPPPSCQPSGPPHLLRLFVLRPKVAYFCAGLKFGSSVSKGGFVFKICALSTHTSRMQAAIALSAWGLLRYPHLQGLGEWVARLCLDLALLGGWPSIHASSLGLWWAVWPQVTGQGSARRPSSKTFHHPSGPLMAEQECMRGTVSGWQPRPPAAALTVHSTHPVYLLTALSPCL